MCLDAHLLPWALLWEHISFWLLNIVFWCGEPTWSVQPELNLPLKLHWSEGQVSWIFHSLAVPPKSSWHQTSNFLHSVLLPYFVFTLDPAEGHLWVRITCGFSSGSKACWTAVMSLASIRLDRSSNLGMVRDFRGSTSVFLRRQRQHLVYHPPSSSNRLWLHMHLVKHHKSHVINSILQIGCYQENNILVLLWLQHIGYL